MKRTFAIWGLAAMLGCAAPILLGGEGSEPKAAAPAGERRSQTTAPAQNRPRPLAGRIAEVDQIHKTIKVGNSVVYITSETRITRDGKPAILEDAKVGDEVGISYVRDETGRMVARSVRIGPRPAQPPRPAPSRPAPPPRPGPGSSSGGQ
ncbi:MAG: DUF5666 domain-containing protein [Limisphaera sp.]